MQYRAPLGAVAGRGTLRGQGQIWSTSKNWEIKLRRTERKIQTGIFDVPCLVLVHLVTDVTTKPLQPSLPRGYILLGEWVPCQGNHTFHR